MIRTKNCAKAVIIEDGKVLLLKKEHENANTIYTLPGGTQETGEPLENAVVRETFEEAAARVEVERLLAVYEHRRPSRSDPEQIKHKVEFAFLCHLTEPYRPHNGFHPDPHQTGVEWLSLDSLSDLTLDPLELEQVLKTVSRSTYNGYLGDLS